MTLDEMVDGMELYAEKYLYSGTVNGAGPLSVVDTYNGWPLDELARTRFPGLSNIQISHCVSALKAKNMLRTSGGGGALRSAGGRISAVGNVAGATLEEMLCMRMRWTSVGSSSFEHVNIHRAGDLIHIWIVTKDGQSLVLQDGWELFPSDALVTKLTMMK